MTITVSGGTINGAIYASGQSAFDAVTGAANVIFTGATNFGCDVFGYSYVGDEDPSAATLSFTGYTGTFGGEVGGFAGITLDGNTTMTLDAAAAINTTAWKFDLEGRVDWLTDTSLLTWTAETGFSGDKVVVNFADEAQAKAGWSIANADFTGATFDLWIGGAATAAVDLALGAAIEGTGTVYDGWGFALEESVLKFKNLA